MGSRTLLTRCFNEFNRDNVGFFKLFSTSRVRTVEKEPDDEIILPHFPNKEMEKELKKALEPHQLPNQISVPKVEDVGLVSGVPEEHIKTRRVRIYQPPKNAMQSGTNNINFWQIDFDTRVRWENPLMGWTSSGDPMSNMKVDFASKEEAIDHCEKMGWKYYIQEPNAYKPKARSYGQNFAWNKRTRVSTK